MKIKSVVLLFAVSVSLAGLNGVLSAAEKAAPKPAAPVKKPALKIDTSPVGNLTSSAVTSYADVLENIRPAVVSVYSSKVVRQRIPEYFRPFLGNQQAPEQRPARARLPASSSPPTDSSSPTTMWSRRPTRAEGAAQRRTRVHGQGHRHRPEDRRRGHQIDVELLPAATLADSAKLRVGDIVFAIGNPLGVGQT